MNKLITATELDKNQKTIMNVVEERVIAFNKKRIVKELRNQRDLKRIELNDENYVLNNLERDTIKIAIVNDEETIKFRENEQILLASQKENYSEIRSTIDSLNEMDKYSVDIERAEIQTVENFRNFETIVNHSILHNQLCMSILKNKRIDINNKLEELKLSNPETFDFNALMENSFELMMKMRQMYNVNTDVDDFELFDKYNLESNIDYAHKISEMLWIKIANGSLSENILNEFLPQKYNNTELNKHVKSQVVSNKMLAILFSKDFISNNSVTTLKTTYTKNLNLEKVYRTRTLGEILLEITNEENKLKSKEERQQIYITYDGMRPSKEEYYKWNGMQVFDIDLKYWIQRSSGNIELLKHELHKHLSDFHWYLWIAISSSGNGIHIYTKVTPPHHVYTKAEDNEYISKYWYTINYITKLHNIYDILHRLHKIKDNNIDFTDFFRARKDVVMHEFNDVEENKYVDNVVSRITAGIRLACDSAPLVNANFIDAHVGLGLGQTLDGFEYHPTIQSVIFRKSKFIDTLNNNLVVESKEDYLNKQNNSGIDLSKFITLNIDIGEIKVIPKNNINYITRYNVCNTLASLFGKDGLSIAHKVLDSQGCNNIEEINSFFSCAISNVKEPSKLGLEILKKTGIIKHVEPELIEITETGYKNDLKYQIESSLINAELNIDYELLQGQYLTDIKSDLLEIITGEKINIVLSPPGSGKCFGKDTLILMYDCTHKKVQDIVPGDLVMGWDSKPRLVKTTCVGNEELFKIIPSFGEPWVCNKSHIMSLHTANGFEQKILNIELSNFLDLSEKEQKPWKLFHKELIFDEQEVDIDPYFLGYWLGDGTSNDVEFTISNSDVYNVLPELTKYIEHFDCEFSEYKYDYMSCPRYRVKSKNYILNNDTGSNSNNKNIIYQKFEKYNLIGNKHIPKEFLYNSKQFRLELFAGIIDSDGTVANKSYCISISKKYGNFKNDLIFLARSLGYFVNCSDKNININGKIYENWYLTISGDFLNVPVLYKRKVISKNLKPLTQFISFKTESLGNGDYYGFELDGPDKMFLLADHTVVHNTELIKKMALDGKRILLVLPYISVIQNKISTDTSVMELFDTFYGTTDIKDIAYGRNAVTTFDKFSRSNYEKISKMFDYIFIDESHLLFTSSYRIEATSNVIKKIKELFYISSNDPFASKIVLMTGTETGESYFFDKVSRITRISKPQMEKKMEFLICGDTLDSITRLANKGATLISQGYRLMIPTNKGEIYSEKIIGMIEYLLQRPIKYGYYKRSNIEQELCRLINEDNTIGDYEIVFCSNYLSVGVDINDKLDGDNLEMKFASIYLGNFSGYEIEQFNARIRKTGITSIYCMTTNKSDGSTNDLLLNEPDLLLKITDEDQLFFIDDKSIAGAKTEFIASYDPVLHRITTPGFSLLNGKIQFNLEEYELVSFENKYSVCMEHPIKVSRELAKYGYQITVSTEFEGLSQSEQETLKKMGIEAAKNEKVRKHNLLVGTFVDLINQNTFANDYGLEYNDAIEWVMKNSDKIVEDRELTREVTLNGVTEISPCFAHIIFDVFATPQQIVVRSREALEKMIKPAKYLISRYSKHKALDIIYQYVDDNGILKQKNFQRAINLLKIIDSSDSNELAEPITKSLEKMYLFVDKFEINKDYRIGYETYQAILDTWTNEYIDYLGIKINTKYGFDKIRDGLVEMLNDLSTKQSGKNGIRFSYNKLPEQDSANILNRRSIDTLITSMFNITENIMTDKRKLKEKHIILKEVSF